MTRFRVATFLIFIFLTASELAAQTQGWVTRGSRAFPRAGHTVTLLRDGTALVAGGENSTGIVAQAEIYNPTTGTVITLTSPLLTPRKHHAALALQDGRILLAGGEGASGILASAEIYDPSTQTFLATGNLNNARSNLTSTLLGDGTVMIIGGEDSSGALNTIEKFDPGTGVFTVQPVALQITRAQHTATLREDGTIFVAGGRNSTGALAGTEYFDPKALTVTAGPSLANARYGHTGTAIMYGNIVLVGGWDGTNVGSTIEVLYRDGKLGVAANSLQIARYDHAAVRLPNNENLLIIGGRNAGGTVNTVESLDAISFQVRSAPALLNPRAEFAVFARNGNVCAIAGNDASGLAQTSTESYAHVTISSDKPDYQPNSIVTLAGTGWTPGEAVQINIRESDGDPDTNLSAIADGQGNIGNSQFSTLGHDGGTVFSVTATGGTSGFVAHARFTDSHFISSLSPSTAQATPSGFTLHILGGNFNASNETVEIFNSSGGFLTNAPIMSVSPTEIDATVPPSISNVAGTYQVKVRQLDVFTHPCCSQECFPCGFLQTCCTASRVAFRHSCLAILCPLPSRSL